MKVYPIGKTLLLASFFLGSSLLGSASANINYHSKVVTIKNTSNVSEQFNLVQERVLNIVPKPLSVKQISGKDFSIERSTIIYYSPKLLKQAEYLQEVLSGSTGYDLKMVSIEKKAVKKLSKLHDAIILVLGPTTLSNNVDESYSMKVNNKQVRVVANDASGAFYGIQTMLQLLPAQVYDEIRHKDIAWDIAPVEIKDAPNRPWRGMMLDVARYFYDKEFVKKYIDMMAMYKLNKLQFHFIDDSGWRLEIKKYPRLTEIGAWAGTDTHRLGGYYTQEDMREIIEYASVRGVEIIPEIEFPAHMLSAVVAYPELSCEGKQHQMPEQHFISRDLLCVGKESSMKFLKDVLDETIELFPSKYINIGGDEAVYTKWKKCPYCQELMKKEGLTDVSQLQGWLTNQVAHMMKAKGRTVVGWEEIIERGKVDEEVVAMVWHNLNDTLKVKKSGHKAVLIPATHNYFDFPESSTPGELKAATWMPPISLEKTYSMPVNDYSAQSTTLGVQACFWSDQFIHGTILQELPYLNENRSENYAEYLTFPRLLALSEVAWGSEKERNFDDFRNRLRTQYPRLDYKKCHYRVPEPIIANRTANSDGSFTYVLESPVEGAEIRYRLDGSYPNVHSPIYTEPLIVKDTADIRAMTVVSPRQYSLPLYSAPDYSAYKKYGKFTAKWKSGQIRSDSAIWDFDCTGKISGNGEYEITFINQKGLNEIKLSGLKVFKRDELVAEDDKEFIITTEDVLSTRSPHIKIYPNSAVATFNVNIDSFEAGTPFTIEIETLGFGGDDSRGLVFIRKK